VAVSKDDVDLNTGGAGRGDGIAEKALLEEPVTALSYFTVEAEEYQS